MQGSQGANLEQQSTNKKNFNTNGFKTTEKATKRSFSLELVHSSAASHALPM